MLTLQGVLFMYTCDLTIHQPCLPGFCIVTVRTEHACTSVSISYTLKSTHVVETHRHECKSKMHVFLYVWLALLDHHVATPGVECFAMLDRRKLYNR